MRFMIITQGGTRAHNLLLKREVPYPLGHMSSRPLCEGQCTTPFDCDNGNEMSTNATAEILLAQTKPYCEAAANISRARAQEMTKQRDGASRWDWRSFARMTRAQRRCAHAREYTRTREHTSRRTCTHTRAHQHTPARHTTRHRTPPNTPHSTMARKPHTPH